VPTASAAEVCALFAPTGPIGALLTGEQQATVVLLAEQAAALSLWMSPGTPPLNLDLLGLPAEAQAGFWKRVLESCSLRRFDASALESILDNL